MIVFFIIIQSEQIQVVIRKPPITIACYLFWVSLVEVINSQITGKQQQEKQVIIQHSDKTFQVVL